METTIIWSLPCDFFLWEYLKSKVRQDITEKKEAIQSEFAAVPRAMFENLIRIFSDRLKEFIELKDTI